MWAYTLLFMIGEYRMNFVQQTVVFIMHSYQIISRLHGKLEPFNYYFIITDLKKHAIAEQRSLLVDLIYRVLSKSAGNCGNFFWKILSAFLCMRAFHCTYQFKDHNFSAALHEELAYRILSKSGEKYIK